MKKYADIPIHVFGCGKKFKRRSVESMSASHYEVVVWQKSRQVFVLVNRCVACLNNVLICWSKKSPRGRCSFFQDCQTGVGEVPNRDAKMDLMRDRRTQQLSEARPPFFILEQRSLF